MILDLGPDPSRCVIARPQHVEVYRKAGEFAGWPANYGLWIWGDEVVVVFAQGLLGREGKIHARDRDHPFRPLQARSHDGGMTWAVEPFLGQVPALKHSLRTNMWSKGCVLAATSFQGATSSP